MTPLPIELTPELTERIANLVEAGNFPEIACRACGVSVGLYRAWIKRGEGRNRRDPPTEKHIQFAERMHEAEAIAETKYVQLIKDGAPKDPALALKFLGRRYKERWAEKVTHEVSWVVKAIHMLRIGEVTLEALESELPTEDFEMVRTKFLESPTMEGEYIDVTEKVSEDAE